MIPIELFCSFIEYTETKHSLIDSRHVLHKFLELGNLFSEHTHLPPVRIPLFLCLFIAFTLILRPISDPIHSF